MSGKQFITVNGTRLAYQDYGGTGIPLLALHDHYGCGRAFSTLAEALGSRYRVITLDQRGHGWSDVPDDYTRAAYIMDLVGVIRGLNLAPAIILGHSLGGLNAYQLAARHPALVRALIIEDIGAQIPPLPFLTEDWPERFASVREVLHWLAEKGLQDEGYLLESLVEYPNGWGFRFRYDTVQRSQRLAEGNWWGDWISSICPALLLYGQHSWVLPAHHAREMSIRRPNTRLVELASCGHAPHDENPAGFHAAVLEFLDSLAANLEASGSGELQRWTRGMHSAFTGTPALRGTMAEKLIARYHGPRAH